MKVFAKVLAILAVLLVLVSLFLVVVTSVFQVGLMEIRFGGLFINSIKKYPVIPIGEILVCLLQLCCFVPMIFLAGRKRGGIWPEMLLMLIMILCIPVVKELGNFASWYIVRGNKLKFSDFQDVLRNYYFWFNVSSSSGAVQLRHAVYYLIDRCMKPAAFAQILTYITCGLSIGLRLMDKKARKKAANAAAISE